MNSPLELPNWTQFHLSRQFTLCMMETTLDHYDCLDRSEQFLKYAVQNNFQLASR
jgi:hypothetical protein